MAEDSAEIDPIRGDASAGEAALREILAVMARSRGDETPVLDVILGHARRLCEVPTAAVVLGRAGDGHQRLAAHHGTSPETVAFYEAGGVPMDPARSFTARAILERRTIHLADMADTEEYRSVVPNVVELVEQQGIRTNLFVPLIRDGEGIGALILFRQEVRPFTGAQIALVEAFAAQAAMAIENVRQFRELQTREQREAATREILDVIARSRDDEAPVFDAILSNAARLCGSPIARLELANEERTRFHMVATWGEELWKSKVGDEWPLDLPHILPTTIREARPFLIDDLADTPEYRRGDPYRQRLVDGEGLRSYLTVPLVSGGKGIGCIALSRREVRPFTQADLALVEAFAAQAVIAIENVRQFRALEASNGEVRAQAEALQSLNEGLEARVASQVGEIERMGRLKRFLSPAVADAVVSSGDDRLLSSHRALIATLFCDIRGFTAFCETAEPEETIEVLQTYHEAMGALIAAHGGGVDHRMGDGIMVIFNDPLPCDDPTGDALRLALAMRERMADLCRGWRRLGHRLGFGVGISLGYATVGMVGSEGRFDYTASGTAVNLAARLCDEAADGEILLSPRAYAAVEEAFTAEPRGEFSLKGIQAPVEVFCVTGSRGADQVTSTA